MRFRLSGPAGMIALMALPCQLRVVACAELQKPPVPEPVTFESRGATLAGDIVFGREAHAAAALVLVAGSGRTERMLNVARLLAGNGFVVLTYDKRGVGQSGGVYWGHDPKHPNIAAANLDLLASDAAAALGKLMQNSRAKGLPAGFVGFSEAGWIIPMAALKAPRTEFIGLWSGPACTVDEQLYFQNWAANAPTFWASHSALAVSAKLGSIAHGANDVDPQNTLSKLRIPGFWVFGADDRSVPVELSETRLLRLMRDGHPFQYEVIPGYGHNVVDTGHAPALEDMAAWIKRIAWQKRGWARGHNGK